MNTTVASILSLALVACSAPAEEPSQGSSGGDAPSGSDTSSETGSSSSGSAQSGVATSGTGSSKSGSSTAGAQSTGASTGRASTGSMSSTGSSLSGANGGTGGTGGSESGSQSGSGSSGIQDAGAAHRDAAPVELTGCAAQVPTAIFGASCEGTACHNARDHEYALDLQSPGVASRLVNQPSLEAYEPDQVTPLKLIDPNNWMQSYILLKVEESMPPAGVQMPQIGTKLSQTQIGCLQQWVEAEAAGPY
jgi:hypothetical protein